MEKEATLINAVVAIPSALQTKRVVHSVTKLLPTTILDNNLILLGHLLKAPLHNVKATARNTWQQLQKEI